MRFATDRTPNRMASTTTYHKMYRDTNEVWLCGCTAIQERLDNLTRNLIIGIGHGPYRNRKFYPISKLLLIRIRVRRSKC